MTKFKNNHTIRTQSERLRERLAKQLLLALPPLFCPCCQARIEGKLEFDEVAALLKVMRARRSRRITRCKRVGKNLEEAVLRQEPVRQEPVSG